MEPNGILIFAQLDEKYNVTSVTEELLSKARKLKEKIWNQRIMTCVIGPRMNYEEIINNLSLYGCDEVVIVNDDRLKEYNKTYYSEIFVRIAKKYPPRIILIGATKEGKEIAAYTSTKLETGLTADCTDLDIGENNLLLSTRPTFGGKLTANILCKTFPQMATVQQNVFKAEKIYDGNINVIFEWENLDTIENKIEIINKSKNNFSLNDITKSEIIVAGGNGACKENGFALIYELAQKLNASIAGSRIAFEKGYITKSQQVGQTGKIVAPKVYIAIGISGADQHLTGIKNSGKIIAVNKDKNAPIFKYADVGIVGDLFTILPELINRFNIDKEEQNEQ